MNNMNNVESTYILKIITICIRSSYYIFCKRNKEWDNPQLMPY
jgi:hypothetical protein